ncbi:hypothetical protein TUM19329_20320 [Legionella antarctica]|uniref:Histone-lysine N-methyltransferase, H3 lysine-79 specific n=1 Tax=Legionella antarctica TaxID=2708020 RepID=A0A6F8T5D8_9GAMM|nr:hypothetical protein [Legionella antarctica]BCA95671.1 hypothetical protein TUM19329_20320 [Legionella antarctica]
MLFHQVSTTGLSINDIDSLCQQYLAILYHDVQRRNDLVINNICETYGEILYPSVDKILSVIQPSDSDVFVDYGSGLGKMVIQFFLKSRVKEAYGIEISPDLYQHSFNAAQRLRHELPGFYQCGRKLTFFLGDFLEVHLETATIAMVTSTCFTQSLLNQLGKIIEHTPSIHTVLSLRPISILERLTFKKTIRLECSWDTELCYVYSDK